MMAAYPTSAWQKEREKIFYTQDGTNEYSVSAQVRDSWERSITT